MHAYILLKNDFIQGYLQNLQVIVNDEAAIFKQCPQSKEITSCPTCGQFQGLQEEVREMRAIFMREIQELSRKLQTAENRLESLEECDCPKSCRAEGGIIREDGASWTEGCDLCSCVVSHSNSLYQRWAQGVWWEVSLNWSPIIKI